MAVTQLAVGVKKQDQNDPAWHTAMNSGFDDLNTRLTLAGAASPEGVTTGHWVGQRYWDITNKRAFIFTGTPGANTGWVVEGYVGSGTTANRATSIAVPFNGVQYVQNSEATLRLLQMYLSGAWANVFSYGAGTNAAKPTLDLPADGLAYFNTDKGHPELRVSSAWVDLWPGIKLQKAESAYLSQVYTAAYAYVKETAGVNDLNVVVTTPAQGSWMILAIGNVVAQGPASAKSILQSELHRGGVKVGTRGGSGHPEVAGYNIAAPCFDVFTAPVASTAYTYKLRAASQHNNSDSIEAGIYTLLLRVN